MENLELNLNGDQKELIVREGKAPEIRQKKGYSLQTTVKSVIDFYQKRKDSILVQDSILKVNLNKGEITLVVNGVIQEETIALNGKMVPSKDYVDLGINSTKLFNESDLASTLRKRPHLFINVDAYEKIMNQLRNFTADVRATFSKSDDRTGKQAVSVNSNVKTDGLEKEFQIKISPWADEEPTVHNIKIYVTNESGQAMFYLECVDLMLSAEGTKANVISDAMEVMKELPILHEA